MTSGGPLHLIYSTNPQKAPKKALNFSVIIFTDECYKTLSESSIVKIIINAAIFYLNSLCIIVVISNIFYCILI